MNFYEVLEIDDRASKEDIERAYRKLARRVHPDLHAGDAGKAEARMKLLNEIRDTLTDSLLRAGYDERLRLEELQRKSEPPARPATVPPASKPPAAPEAEPTPRRAGPILLGFAGAMVAGILYLSFREPRPAPSASEALETAPAGAPAPAPTDTSTTTPQPPPGVAPAPRPRPGSSPRGLGTTRALGGPRGPFHGHGVVRIGSTAEDVIHILGTPDSVEPGRQSGDAVLHYGTLRLEMQNGRVTSGGAAAR